MPLDVAMAALLSVHEGRVTDLTDRAEIAFSQAVSSVVTQTLTSIGDHAINVQLSGSNNRIG